jgi:outer membrane protein OmpA-like peptidoglycan-associated protein
MQRAGRNWMRWRNRGTALLCLGLVLPLPACGLDRPWPPGATVIVVGNRANMPAPQIKGKVADLLEKAIESQDDISVVAVSGEPTPVGTVRTKSSCGSTMECQNPWADFRKRVQLLVSSSQAQQPEADLLGAVDLAAQTLKSAEGSKHLIIMDSGLQTAGVMPLQYPGAFQIDPMDLVKSLETELAVPDLHGVDVVFTGLGSTYEPQKRPLEGNLIRLERLWRAILEKTNSRSLDIDTAPLANAAPQADLPTVTPVSFTVTPPPTKNPPPCVRLRADQVGFNPDRDTFRDPQQASKVLQPIADRIKKNGLRAKLTGTTALPDIDPTSPQRLSYRRAQAVQRVLIELGVSAASIRGVEGVGTNFKGFVDDTDSKGRLIETKAIQNRLVIIELTNGACS